MRISDWSSDVCSSDLVTCCAKRREGGVDVDRTAAGARPVAGELLQRITVVGVVCVVHLQRLDQANAHVNAAAGVGLRSEERRVGRECVSTCRSRWSTYT